MKSPTNQRAAAAKQCEENAPLRVLFIITSMPVGGAETLLVNLIRRIDRQRFAPELCCLKELGPLGEELAGEIPTHHRMLAGKFDPRIWPRLVTLLRDRQIDAVVTVGAGDKMFWGRLCAKRAGVPVVISALHSTGWPDGVGRLNRWLTPLTDAFVAVAQEHGRYMIDVERFGADKVQVIPNGVDTDRFIRDEAAGIEIRKQLNIGIDDPVVGIVAALRPEKNHELLFRAVEEVSHDMPSIRLLIVGDGPRRQELKQRVLDRSIGEIVHFLGNRTDVPAILSALDLFALSSHNEANPVSILEAMSIGLPVVAPRVGSISESVLEGTTGYLVSPGSLVELTDRIKEILSDQVLGRRMGEEGRRVVLKNWSLETMVAGYERLITDIYEAKRCGTLFRASKVNNDDDPSSTEGDKNSEKDDSELVAGVSGGF